MRAKWLNPLIFLVALQACVSRTAPVRPSDGTEVRASRSATTFRVDLSPLEVILVARQFLVDQGMPLGVAESADTVVAEHAFLEDGYRISVEARMGGTRVTVEGRTPGGDPLLAERVEALARGLEARLTGGDR